MKIKEFQMVGVLVAIKYSWKRMLKRRGAKHVFDKERKSILPILKNRMRYGFTMFGVFGSNLQKMAKHVLFDYFVRACRIKLLVNK